MLLAASACVLAFPAPARAQHMNMPGTPMPMPPQPAAKVEPDHAGHDMAMSGALGPYPMGRESSGTAWQPDSSAHHGIETRSHGWT
jgi:hypothetical protein